MDNHVHILFKSRKAAFPLSDDLGLSMAEIARRVGVTTSSIAKAIARLKGE